MTQYIGYDLGDGDTLVSYRRNAGEGIKDAHMPGRTAEQQGTPIPTLLAVDKDGATTIGKAALDLDRNKTGGGNLVELAVNFKRRPSTLGKDEYRVFKDRVVRFTDALFLHTEFFEKTIDPADSEFFLRLGYPTLWNDEDVERYREILESCGFIEEYRKKGINVSVGLEKESRAAMLNIVNRTEAGTASKENVKIENGSYIVVFDFGSSTTDVTVLQREGEYKVVPWDYGDCNLGARLIDRGIYDLVLEKLDSKTQQGLKNDDYLKSKSVYMCREAKERYFGYTDKERANVDWENALQAPKIFPLGWYFNGAMVHDAAALKRPELEGVSYKDAVRKLFTGVAKSMKEKGAQPSLIILTGGASRMDFVKRLCEETFAKTKIYLDDAPSSCISRGLVYTATIAEKVAKFEKRMKEFCASSKIGAIIDDEMSALTSELAAHIGREALDIIEKKLYAWRDSRISTLSKMEKEIKSSVENYLNGSECRLKIKRITEDWYSERVIRRINREIEKICNEFDIVYQNQLLAYVKGVQCGMNNITISGTTVKMEPAVAGAIQELFLTVMPLVLIVLMPIIGPTVVSVVVGIVSAITTIIAGLIFTLLGTVIPGGWAMIAAIVCVGMGVLLFAGWEALKDQFMIEVKEFNLPAVVRNRVSNDKIRSELAEQRSKINDEISYKIRNDSRFRSELKDKISSASSKIVEAVAKQITFDLSR